MKFRGTNSLSPSIALWLEQQLELRGIDSVVYTRYVLSLLNDEAFDKNDLVTFGKGNKKLSSSKSCNLEDLKRSAVVQCLTEAADQAFDIENLVDELCVKLKEAEREGDECLKEKTNSEILSNHDLHLSNSDLASRYYSAFPALSKGSPLENTLPLASVWSRNICRALGGGRKRGDSESSIRDSKVSKRKENKENVLCGSVNIGGVRRMRSRSTVKQSSGHHYRNREKSAKSLDRKVDEISTAMKRSYGATKTMSCADVDNAAGNQDSGNEMGDPKGKKSLNFFENSFGQLGFPVSSETSFEEFIPQHWDHKLSRTPGRKCSLVESNNNDYNRIGLPFSASEFYDSAELPVDFKQLLTSPIEANKEFKLPHSLFSGAASGNFIQCGTNITSSIWSDTCEKMEEDESSGNSGNWETKCSSGINNAGTGGCSKWSDARSSILSSAWKLPFVYDKDIEGTSLAVNANLGSFYSFFDINSNTASFLTSNDEKASKVDVEKTEDNKGDIDPVVVEEEDLLTSMKTHFRPIKNNENSSDVQNGGTAVEGGSCVGVANKQATYKDGSTFTDTLSSPVKLDYGRSESGAFFLVTSGEKYLEFKRTSPNYLHLNSQQSQEQFSSKETSSSFVPKFKIQQNEKFCQTDSPMTEIESGFFFPGDERLAEELVNDCFDDHNDEDEVETEDNHECSDGKRNDEDSRQTIQVSGWVTAWPIGVDSHAGIWASVSDSNDTKPWMFGKNDEAIDIVDTPSQHDDCRMDDRNEHYLRLKDELSEDGDELLSDLSSIHLFLDPERLEDPQPPHDQKALTVESARL